MINLDAPDHCVDCQFVLAAFELKWPKARVVPSWPMRLHEPLPYYFVMVQANMRD